MFVNSGRKAHAFARVCAILLLGVTLPAPAYARAQAAYPSMGPLPARGESNPAGDVALSGVENGPFPAVAETTLTLVPQPLALRAAEMSLGPDRLLNPVAPPGEFAPALPRLTQGLPATGEPANAAEVAAIQKALAAQALPEATALAAGGEHTCALTTDGGLKCWGSSEYGQVGDNSTTRRLTPANVDGLSSDVEAVSTGWRHSCALTAGGGVKCWGDNEYGQLGDDSTTVRWTPVDVVGLDSGYQAIAAGWYHTCALSTTGGVKCWGNNSNGQLGDGTSADRWTPVDVVGLGSGVRAIVAGGRHTCAMTAGGGVKCWGSNVNGRLGNNSETNRLAPVDVVGLGSSTLAITAGGHHTCALSVVGGVKCWGSNEFGQVGDGSTTDRWTPAGVFGLAGGVKAIAAGGVHTCVLTTTGGVKCWGNNGGGRLGDNSNTLRLTPVDVAGLSNGVEVVSAGRLHTCVVTEAGGIKCWGHNDSGRLGDSTTTNRWAPVDVAGFGGGAQAEAAGAVQSIAAGYSHTCAVGAAGGLKCWGSNEYGQLGDQSTMERWTPVAVSGLSGGVRAVAAGGGHTCALTTGGGVKCWGLNASGQLGENSAMDRLAPVDVVGLSRGVQAITAGDMFTCALTTGGGVKCWGNNVSGQLGDNSDTERWTPVDVAGLSSGVLAISGGERHTCALTAGGGVKCWGSNSSGQLGDNSDTDSWTPVDVVGLTSGVLAIAARGVHTCALTTNGGVKCWGWNGAGQLGDDSTTDSWTPVDVVGLRSGVLAIAAGWHHVCSLTAGGGVKCWGNNSFGRLGDDSEIDRWAPVDVVGLSSGVQSIAAGAYHTCALTSAGDVKCWGSNESGRLGDNSEVDRWTPVDVVGLSSGVAATVADEAENVAIAGNQQIIAAGTDHTCALSSAGGVKCWGSNEFGQLGDNSTTHRRSPADVAGLGGGVRAIVSGGDHTCALTTGGGVKCWGLNDYGQLGDNSTTLRRAPVDVVGLSSGVMAIAAGWGHTCALTTGGGVKCWGYNSRGRLGDNSTTERWTPVDVVGLSSGVVAIAAGGSHTCALTSGGGVKCWGINLNYQLGDGSDTERWTPVDVVGLSSGVQSITAGGSHSCALTAGGGVKCWGDNWYVQLGNDSDLSSPFPVDVVGLSSGTLAIAAGYAHTCALTTGGGMKCWGLNWNGQLGDDSDTNRRIPVGVTGLDSGVTAMALGEDHTCAMTTAGDLLCWGANGYGKLGDNTLEWRWTPVDVVGLSSGVAAVVADEAENVAIADNQQVIAAGDYHTCALSPAGGVKCWGSNESGQLGIGSDTERWTPVDVVGLSSGVVAIAAGGSHTCALTSGGGVKCWGRNHFGQVGDGSVTERWTPVDVVGLSSGVQSIAAGGLHTCALTNGGGVKCWGWNGAGQLGDGSDTERWTPVDVVGLSSGVLAIAAGDTYTCALTSGGVKCWGYNIGGQLGDNSDTERWTPVDVVGLGSDVLAITAGGEHTCALTAVGGVKCWGTNYSGRLGDNSTTGRWTPVDVIGLSSGVVAIAAGGRYTCALTSGGGVKCWGSNVLGYLGDGSNTDRWTPVDVTGLDSGVQSIEAGANHTCALTSAGDVKCWGSNTNGRLGDSSDTDRWTPVYVVGFGG